ncbi:MAG: right-handed parallel beta-helix repeat-containing protein, partial [Candidatus Methylomirabilis sp.]|nr:right-handed parallel beta-helix repeat-containing protein [Deltaproteobacteria bacterium]
MKFVAQGLVFVVLLGLAAPPLAAAATFTVTKTADTADGVCDADCSLREAVIAANANDDADEIVLGAGIFALTVVGDDATAQAGDLDISASVTIRGAGAAQTTVDGAGVDRVFHLYNQFPTGRTVTIRDMTIRGGDARDRPAAVTGMGGGVLNDGLEATLEDCVIEENIASSGGGVANFGIPADLTLRRSVIRNNDAGSGGGVLSGYQSRLVVEDATISGNSATSGGGGGLQFSTFAQATISGSTISDNGAAGDGGGVQAQDAAVSVANSTIPGNAAGGPSGRGGGA